MEMEDRQALERALMESERARRESESLRLLVAALTGKLPEPSPLEDLGDSAHLH